MGPDASLSVEVTEFILKRVKDKLSPYVLLDELSRFLDEEAEGFLMQMWKLLIFEQLKLNENNNN